MDTYLVISTHTAEDCDQALKYFQEYHQGFLTKFWWGCLDHDHNGYAIIEAENHDHAKLAVPPLAREKAKIIKLTHFSQHMPHPE
jgi:hypothetical protein